MSTDPLPADESIPPSSDDRAIGRAFRVSLVVLGAVGLVTALAILIVGRDDSGSPSVKDAAIEGPAHEDRQATAPVVRFVDITREAGIDFVHVNGATGRKWLPETMGGGAAFFDFDRDGDADLLLVNGTDWDGSGSAASRLYRNDGKGGFADVTRELEFDCSGVYGMGVAIGDVDGDGWLDLYITAYGQNQLFRNVSGKRFQNVTESSGTAGTSEMWSTSAAFFDADGDLDLDLFVCNYVGWSPEIDAKVDFQLTGIGRAYGPPTNFEGTFCKLYRNDGDFRFEDVSRPAGMEVTNESTGRPAGKALAVRPFDLEDDGDLDLFVANDTVRNFLFRNQGNGKFEEVGFELGVAYTAEGKATGAMGVDFAHYRNDDTVGIGVGNFSAEMSSLYVSADGKQVFSDDAVVEGIGATSRKMLTFGLFFFDYDLDGRLDLLQANGHLEEDINEVQASQTYRQPAQLFWNTGRERMACFMPAADAGDLTRPIVGRGATCADIDGDGDLDVLLTQIAGPPLLLRNDLPRGHHWLRLRLEQPGPNPHAIGARVILGVGRERLERQVMPARSYLSQVELPLTFGLGETTKVDRARVIWPDGASQELGSLELDRLHVIRRR